MPTTQNNLHFELTFEQHELLYKHFPNYLETIRNEVRVKLYEMLLESTKLDIK